MQKKDLDLKLAPIRAQAEKALTEMCLAVSHMLLYRAVFTKAQNDEEEETLIKQITSLASEIYPPEKKRELLHIHQMCQQHPVNTSLFPESLYKAEEIVQGLDETVNQVTQRFQELRKELEEQQVNQVFRSVSLLPDDDFDASQPPPIGFEEALNAISSRLKKSKEEQDKPLSDLQPLLSLLLDTLSYLSYLLENAKTVAEQLPCALEG